MKYYHVAEKGFLNLTIVIINYRKYLLQSIILEHKILKFARIKHFHVLDWRSFVNFDPVESLGQIISISDRFQPPGSRTRDLNRSTKLCSRERYNKQALCYRPHCEKQWQLSLFPIDSTALFMSCFITMELNIFT